MTLRSNSRVEHSVKIADDGPYLNAVLFIDYENASVNADELFCRDGGSAGFGHFHPWALGEAICDTYNERCEGTDVPRLKLTEVRVYRGKHEADRDFSAHALSSRRAQAWCDSAIRPKEPHGPLNVHVSRPLLQYETEWRAAERERLRPVEKEVDTGIAVDLVGMAIRQDFDVAILFSEDQDMRPVMYEILARSTTNDVQRVDIAGWCRGNDKRILNLQGLRRPQWGSWVVHKMDRNRYERVADTTDYLAKVWSELERMKKNRETFDVRVMRPTNTRNGFLVNYAGIHGLLPFRHIGYSDRGDRGTSDQDLWLPAYEGRTLSVKAIEVEPSVTDRGTLIVSEQAVEQERNQSAWLARRRRLLDGLLEGQILTGRVSEILPDRVWVDLDGAYGVAPRDELSWREAPDPATKFAPGELVDMYVKFVNQDRRKVDIWLSFWRARDEEWREFDRYVRGRAVPATVLNRTDTYARVKLLGTNVVCLAIVGSEGNVGPEHGIVPVVVRLMDEAQRRHQIFAEFSDVRTETEDLRDWTFDGDGRVIRLPDDLAAELRIEQGD